MILKQIDVRGIPINRYMISTTDGLVSIYIRLTQHYVAFIKASLDLFQFMVCGWLSHMHRWAPYCHPYVFLGFSNNSINVLFIIPHLACPMKGRRYCTWVVVIIRSQPTSQYMPNKYSEVRLTAQPSPTIPESIARRISPLMILFWKLKNNKLGIQLGGTSYVPTQALDSGP